MSKYYTAEDAEKNLKCPFTAWKDTCHLCAACWRWNEPPVFTNIPATLEIATHNRLEAAKLVDEWEPEPPGEGYELVKKELRHNTAVFDPGQYSDRMQLRQEYVGMAAWRKPSPRKREGYCGLGGGIKFRE